DLAASRVSHAANQAIAYGHVELFHIQQVHRLQAHLRGAGAEFVQRNLLVAPAQHRLLHAAFARNRRVLLRPQRRWDGSHSHTRKSALQHVSSRYSCHIDFPESTRETRRQRVCSSERLRAARISSQLFFDKVTSRYFLKLLYLIFLP